MTVFAYRCTACSARADVDHPRDERPLVECYCGLSMVRDYGSLQLSPSATPNRKNTIPPKRANGNSWEKGIVTVDRGGFKLPLIHANSGRPIRVKEYQNNRSRFEENRRRNHA